MALTAGISTTFPRCLSAENCSRKAIAQRATHVTSPTRSQKNGPPFACILPGDIVSTLPAPISMLSIPKAIPYAGLLELMDTVTRELSALIVTCLNAPILATQVFVRSRAVSDPI